MEYHYAARQAKYMIRPDTLAMKIVSFYSFIFYMLINLLIHSILIRLIIITLYNLDGLPCFTSLTDQSSLAYESSHPQRQYQSHLITCMSRNLQRWIWDMI